MFQIDPVFGQRNATTGVFEWFYESGEAIHGPFPTQSLAQQGYAAAGRAEPAKVHLAVNDQGPPPSQFA